MPEPGKNSVAPRLAPEQPLPPYYFVPGQSPHPRSNPAGHGFGTPPPTPSLLDPERWQESATYLYGLDLFNSQFYWECHEQLESLWLGCGRRGVAADFLKGLIHLAAAGVKQREGRPAGVASHAGRAAELWRTVGQSLASLQAQFFGFSLEWLVKLAEVVRDRGWPTPPPILMPALLDACPRQET